jgi:hypothetical protein
MRAQGMGASAIAKASRLGARPSIVRLKPEERRWASLGNGASDKMSLLFLSEPHFWLSRQIDFKFLGFKPPPLPS